ncbi:hypothetical protein QFC22_005564 [Naganishia vaughanmartiniae]|uniref:Uncharacterized protein n=1 Tax=Naganishia vaughanmartiniae TaxID=1424756 RepID=A0ACC2WT73_9TREE|nr:hypothetical protein QFC22_005564 [Naganishia vaughanmartiniae]
MLSEPSRDYHYRANSSQAIQQFPNHTTPLPLHYPQYMPPPPPTQLSVSQFPNVQHAMMNVHAQPTQTQFPMHTNYHAATPFQLPQPVPFPHQPFHNASNSHFGRSYAFNPRFSAPGGGTAAGHPYENGSTAVAPVAMQSYGKVWPRGNYNLPSRQQRFPVPNYVLRDWPTVEIPSQAAPPQPHVLRMPSTVTRLVSTCLAAERSFATLANFNVTCRAIHKVSLPHLWRTVYWNWGALSEEREGRKGKVELDGWDVGYRAAKEWEEMRWNEKLQTAKGGNDIKFLSGPPLHRHFFVPWSNRSKWIPLKLAKSLKAGITYMIDASSASPASSTCGSSSVFENAATTEELEIYLCAGYRFGTDDVVALLDAVEPPSQDTEQGDYAGLSSSFVGEKGGERDDDDDDKRCVRAGDGYTRLVFFIDKVSFDTDAAAVADDEEERRWSSPTQEAHSDQQAVATSILQGRNYPWLRYVDLVVCSSADFNEDGDAKALKVMLEEGLTVLTSAVRDWYFDEEARPELVVKGVNVGQARLSVQFVSEFIKQHHEFGCIVFKIGSADIVPSTFTSSTGSLKTDILQPMRTAYAALWSSPSLPSQCIGSTHVTSLGFPDQPDHMPPHVYVEASVGMEGDGGAIKVEVAEDGNVVWRDVMFCYMLASRMRSSWS